VFAVTLDTMTLDPRGSDEGRILEKQGGAGEHDIKHDSYRSPSRVWAVWRNETGSSGPQSVENCEITEILLHLFPTSDLYDVHGSV
jgi:hypothetical protein